LAVFFISSSVSTTLSGQIVGEQCSHSVLGGGMQFL